jgi:hypothetical protein
MWQFKIKYLNISTNSLKWIEYGEFTLTIFCFWNL